MIHRHFVARPIHRLQLWAGQAIRLSERQRSVLGPPQAAAAPTREPRSNAMRAGTPAFTGVILTSQCSSTAVG